MKLFAFVLILLLCVTRQTVFAQKNDRPYQCGYYSKSFAELKENYNHSSKYCNVQKGEQVASIGVSNGYVEVQLATFNDGIHWTLQDIDTGCLNKSEFHKVLAYHEKLKGAPINGTFNLVAGSEHNTGLKRNFYDRVLLLNVYHELSDKDSILIDIAGTLKQSGVVVIMERMAKKPGEKRKDCGKLKPVEPELIAEMSRFGFTLSQKEIADEKILLTFYTFSIQQRTVKVLNTQSTAKE